MKVNELMIGDLLKWKEQPGFNDEDRNMVLRVKNIFDDAIKIEGRFGLYHISLFEPIPLIPEVLEKNGWKWNEYHTMLNLVVGTIHVGWGFYKDCLSISDHLHDGDCQISSLKCIYVHQLQHALRLCGIEKEIIL